MGTRTSSFTASLAVVYIFVIYLCVDTEAVSPSEDRKQFFIETILAEYPGAKVNPCPCDNSTNSVSPQIRPPQSCAQKARDEYQGTNIVDSRDPSIPIWPFVGMPLPSGSLQRILCRIACQKSTTGDMDLTQLVRVLYLTSDAALQTEIVSGLQAQYDSGELRFWLQPGESHHCHWTENHIAMWLSCTYLLRPWLNLTATDDAVVNLDVRLHHLLDTKIEYGFYEFFSTTYHPFTLAALLNLFDFAPDTTIQTKALQAATRMMEEWLLLINEQGSFYPAAGRNFDHRYLEPRFLSIAWFLTGDGVSVPGNWRLDYVGAFLATSSIDLEPIISKRTPVVDTQLNLGHSINDHKMVHGQLDTVDRIMFQWSAGGYLHPVTAWDTDYLVDSYSLIDHILWDDFRQILELPSAQVAAVAELFPGLSSGTNIAEARVHIYKHHGVVLTSLEDFNVGYRSGEQWIWAATVGDIAVWTQSGVTGDCFFPDLGNVANIHIPGVKQQGNVALISYRPSMDIQQPPIFLPQFDIDSVSQVSLYFPENRFDEVMQADRWILGRQNENYIGVWRYGLDKTNCTNAADPRYCDEYYFVNSPHSSLGTQVWAVVVGNNYTHGNFSHFSDIVQQGRVTERTVPWSLATKGFNYTTSLSVDGKLLYSTLM